jgi:hypothetical protein
MLKCDCAVVGDKLTRYNSVKGCNVIKEHPIARVPQLSSLSPNVLTQTANNIAVELCSQAQRTRSRTAIGWRSMELVSKLFDTPL